MEVVRAARAQRVARPAQPSGARPRRDAVQLAPSDPVAVVGVQVLVDVRRREALRMRARVCARVRDEEALEGGARRRALRGVELEQVDEGGARLLGVRVRVG